MSIRENAEYRGNAARETTVPFHMMIPEDRARARLIARRAVQLVRDMQRRNPRPEWIDPDAMLIEMDVCTLHLSRPMRLQAWLESDDLAFLHEFFVVTRVFASLPGARACGFFPQWVRLEFAAPSDTPTLGSRDFTKGI